MIICICSVSGGDKKHAWNFGGISVRQGSGIININICFGKQIMKMWKWWMWHKWQMTDVLQVLGLNRLGNCVRQISKWRAIMDLTSVYCQDWLNLWQSLWRHCRSRVCLQRRWTVATLHITANTYRQLVRCYSGICNR